MILSYSRRILGEQGPNYYENKYIYRNKIAITVLKIDLHLKKYTLFNIFWVKYVLLISICVSSGNSMTCAGRSFHD